MAINRELHKFGIKLQENQCFKSFGLNRVALMLQSMTSL